jgi:hypothetical protein
MILDHEIVSWHRGSTWDLSHSKNFPWLELLPHESLTDSSCCRNSLMLFPWCSDFLPPPEINFPGLPDDFQLLPCYSMKFPWLSMITENILGSEMVSWHTYSPRGSTWDHSENLWLPHEIFPWSSMTFPWLEWLPHESLTLPLKFLWLWGLPMKFSCLLSDWLPRDFQWISLTPMNDFQCNFPKKFSDLLNEITLTLVERDHPITCERK